MASRKTPRAKVDWSAWLTETSGVQLGADLFVISHHDWDREELVISVIDATDPKLRLSVRFSRDQLAVRTRTRRFNELIRPEIDAMARSLRELCREHEDCRASFTLARACWVSRNPA